jgi:hypothetical protein
MLTREVVVLVTGTTSHAGDSLSRGTSPHIHPVLVAIVSLPREISSGVAVHAPWMMENRNDRLKRRGGGYGIIASGRSVNVLDSRVFSTGGESPKCER